MRLRCLFVCAHIVPHKILMFDKHPFEREQSSILAIAKLVVLTTDQILRYLEVDEFSRFVVGMFVYD